MNRRLALAAAAGLLLLGACGGTQAPAEPAAAPAPTTTTTDPLCPGLEQDMRAVLARSLADANMRVQAGESAMVLIRKGIVPPPEDPYYARTAAENDQKKNDLITAAQARNCRWSSEAVMANGRFVRGRFVWSGR